MDRKEIKNPSKVVIIPRPTTGGGSGQKGEGNDKTILSEPEELVPEEPEGNETVETGPEKK